MNEEQEFLVLEGLRLLIESSDKIRDSKKQVWLMDYNDFLNPKDSNTEQKIKDSLKEEKDLCKCGHSKSFHVQGIGGCTHSSKKDGDKRDSIFTSVDDWDCDCNKFQPSRKEAKKNG